MAELRYGEVGGERCLFAFFSDDADADVGSLDHRNVVAAVADTAHTLVGERANEARDLGLLRGRAPTRHDDGELRRDLDELVAEVVEEKLQ